MRPAGHAPSAAESPWSAIRSAWRAILMARGTTAPSGAASVTCIGPLLPRESAQQQL